ncbi:ankyrin repeat domain-containing protein [Trinickia sp. LjRoot230]|uniref:ankyrin repeat domain-containing protein n=1 Tax=Trinickia sp. LjRoot230 TaxID=3342288 RepID=UPI003ECDD551
MAAFAALTMAEQAFAADTDSVIKAVKFDDEARVAKLLKAGMDPNTTTPDKLQMPLVVLAAREKSENVAKLLAENPNTDLEKLDSAGENAMMLAALNGDIALVKLLIDKGAEVNKKGWAPLHYAAANGHDDIVQLLVAHSAYLDAASPNGTTPLMMAARANRISTMKVLLDAGADPRLKNQIGMTALDFAKRYNAKDATEGLEAMFARAGASASGGAPTTGQNGAK